MPEQDPWRRVEAVMEGREALEDQDSTVRSLCSKSIYDVANRILKLDHAARKPEIGSLPDLLRPHIENEIWRIWRLRNGK